MKDAEQKISVTNNTVEKGNFQKNGIGEIGHIIL